MLALGATALSPYAEHFIGKPVPTRHFVIQVSLIDQLLTLATQHPSLQSALIAVSKLVATSSIRHLQAKTGLPLINQVAGWSILGTPAVPSPQPTPLTAPPPATSLIYPLLARPQHPSAYSKLLSIVLAFGPLFVILAISVEGLYFLAFAGALVAWVEAEVALRAGASSNKDVDGKALVNGVDGKEQQIKDDKRTKVAASLAYTPRADDLRIALFFLLFVQVAFFGFGKCVLVHSRHDTRLMYTPHSVASVS